MKLYMCPQCKSLWAEHVYCSRCGLESNIETVPVTVPLESKSEPPKPILSLSELGDLIVRLRKLLEDSAFWTSDARTALVGVITDLDAKFNAKIEGAKREPEHELPSLTPSELAEISRLARLGTEQYRHSDYRLQAIALVDKFRRSIQ